MQRYEIIFLQKIIIAHNKMDDFTLWPMIPVKRILREVTKILREVAGTFAPAVNPYFLFLIS